MVLGAVASTVALGGPVGAVPAQPGAGNDAARAQAPPGGAGDPAAPTRVALVGDSIMAGAVPQLDASLRAAGFDPIVDAQESRSTSRGADSVGLYAAAGVDEIVVMLGANDSGDPDLFASRVAEVIAAADGVDRLYWITIPEVRDYYPAANRIVADQLAARPGAKVLDWNSVLVAGDLTGGDGMHLRPEGADALAAFVTMNLSADRDQAAADAGEARLSTTTVDPATERDVARVATDSDPVETAASPGGVVLAVLLVAVILGASGVAVALWALWNSRPLRASSGLSKAE
ncbi:MAG: hypothetical protein ACK5O2_04660 [Microthrixaceae bacterium]